MNDLGLHARPAAKIAEVVKQAKSKVWLIKDGEQVDASSIIDILTLACLKGSTITIQADDDKDVDILDMIADMFENRFEE